MLKLPKGLKKKKKNKKSKKNQELFTEEELEQFKREQKARQLAEEQEQEHQQEHQQEQHPHQQSSKSNADDNEWSKFNQLTTGIDTVLKKTQGDLDRIKETSFFQRVAPPKPKRESKKLQSEEVPKEVAEAQPSKSQEELEEEAKVDSLKAGFIELSESEEESEEGDDIFDTNYIDTLTSGNVPLAYVPDSPEEVDEGPDPFDTAYADKIIKGPEVSKRGKKIVNIGSAVEVLTGRVEKINTKVLKRPRRGPQNLLLESFDKDTEDFAGGSDTVVVSHQPVHTLLDDPADELPDIPIDLSTSLHLQFVAQKGQGEKGNRLEDFDKDEFDDLAAESLTKKDEVTVVQDIVAEPVLTEDGDWSAFEGEPHPSLIVEVPDDFDIDGDDPFDTAYVATVIKEDSLEDDDFDPRAGEPQDAKEVVQHVTLAEPVRLPDLLSGSTTDLSDLSHIPVIAASDSIDVEKEFDPFDTSGVSSLVQPKETEIKFLEKELLSELKHSLSDPDFDPRCDEKLVPAQTTAERKSSLSLNISGVSHNKTVGFAIPSNLTVNDGSEHRIQKPLTPYYSNKSIEEAVDVIEEDLSDSDFNPRASEPASDLLTVSVAHDIKVLTPATEIKANEQFESADPFDTSNVTNALVPGKAELKLLENELIAKSEPVKTAVLDTNSDSQELGLGDKVLTPHVCLSAQESLEDIDPFDTSFANNIAPGQAEIKLLESELIHK